MIVYFNGEYKSSDQVKISPFDHGFLYGVGAFETFRTYNGQPFLFEAHWNRLQNALKELWIDLEESPDTILESLTHLLYLNDMDDASFRLNISAGNAGPGLHRGWYQTPNVMIVPRPLAELPKEKDITILKAPRNTPEGAQRLKSHHFLNNIIGLREVVDRPATEGVFLDERGFICEGTTSNIFWVKEGALYTPAPETGLLRGVTRQCIIELAEREDIPVRVGLFSKEALFEADEIFVTNSVQEVMPVGHIETFEMPGANGVLTSQIRELYKQKIEQAVQSTCQ